MSEEPANYLGLDLALKGLEQRRQAIEDDPAASYWLKQAVTELWKRDVVDALHDLDVLRELLEAKHRTVGSAQGEVVLSSGYWSCGIRQ